MTEAAAALRVPAPRATIAYTSRAVPRSATQAGIRMNSAKGTPVRPARSARESQAPVTGGWL